MSRRKLTKYLGKPLFLASPKVSFTLFPTCYLDQLWEMNVCKWIVYYKVVDEGDEGGVICLFIV